MEKEDKKFVELEVYGTGEELSYVGRLLGLISEAEYAALVEKKDIRKKIMTVATTPLEEISEMDDVDDLRLALAVKSRDSKTIAKKILFVSEPLEHISSVTAPDDVSFVGKEGSFITAVEV